jgi:hypothetical protein
MNDRNASGGASRNTAWFAGSIGILSMRQPLSPRPVSRTAGFGDISLITAAGTTWATSSDRVCELDHAQISRD